MIVRSQAPWMRPGDRLVVQYAPTERRQYVVTSASTSVNVVASRLYANGETKNGPRDIDVSINSAQILEWWRNGRPRYIEPYWHPKPPT